MTADENKLRQDYNTALYKMHKSDPFRESLRGAGQSYFPPPPLGPAN